MSEAAADEIERDPLEVDRLVEQRLGSLQSELVQQEIEELVDTPGATERVVKLRERMDALREYRNEHGSGAGA